MCRGSGDELPRGPAAGACGRTPRASSPNTSLARARARRGERPRFTDKQLRNFLARPRILRAFPRARIVHLTRHPLAACYAVFNCRFAWAYPFANELGELGRFYTAYGRLLAHWRRVPRGRVFDVAYEDLVTAPEPTVRGLFGFLELSFEAQCLDLHLNPAPASTASAVQVGRRLHGTALELWRHLQGAVASSPSSVSWLRAVSCSTDRSSRDALARGRRAADPGQGSGSAQGVLISIRSMR